MQQLSHVIPKLREQLCTLLKNLDREDTQSIQALLIDLTGNRNAGAMLWHLFYWWQRSGDGETYMSHSDWWAEIRLTRQQLRGTTTALQNVGVEVSIKKANGAPTNHYRLNVKMFLRSLAAMLGLSPIEMVCLMRKTTQTGHRLRQNRMEDCVETTSSITKTSTKTKKQVVVEDTAATPSGDIDEMDIDPLVRKIFPGKQADKLIRQHGIGRVVEVCRAAAKEARNPAKWAAAALNGSWLLKNPGREVNTRAYFAEPGEVINPIEDSRPVRQLSQCDIDPAAETTWMVAFQQMELQFNRTTFDSWLRGARLVSASAGQFVVEVKNTWAAEMCGTRIYREIVKLLRDVVGGPAEVSFVGRGAGA